MKPEGVRIVRPDGTELAVELIHEGEDDDGMDVWLVANAAFRFGLDKLLVAVLPARTTVKLQTHPFDLRYLPMDDKPWAGN